MKWVWVKIRPPGIGPQVLVYVTTYQGKPPPPNEAFASEPQVTFDLHVLPSATSSCRLRAGETELLLALK